ncbi:uncharacterized protein F5Z01DRAFT_677942 [Emericellopsis atlantica]|uniref:Ribosomal protein L34 n=1 Tax=Emericellopsis atlantica TaxID=2614577 RepID=A0A9P7ZE34_9HYPO|nr:uncharacterized protein F5Z01DRAFT_677942 [Emericellopsis atlantica]KAG9250256.1 hypothetical protein F5Z01DRAFT_677942 [Emericellopsis atlantica]
MNVLRSLPRVARTSAASPRTFTTLIPHRPTVALPRTTAPSFTPSVAAEVDLVPKSAITSHPALGTIRCGPRNTMHNHTRLVQKRRFGFLKRLRSKTGRRILLRRKIKGRKDLAQG